MLHRQCKTGGADLRGRAGNLNSNEKKWLGAQKSHTIIFCVVHEYKFLLRNTKLDMAKFRKLGGVLLRRIIVLISFLSIALILNGCMGGGGQTGNLEGKIYDKGTKNLVTEIVVVTVGSKQLPVTDGQYSFTKLSAGKQTLKAEAIGYKQYSEVVTITSGKTTTKDIYLEKMEDPEVKVTGVSLDKVSISLIEDSSYPLVATISPANATNQNVTWSSSKDDIAIVDQNGKVQALKAGTAIITAKTEDGNHEASCEVTVTALMLKVPSEYTTVQAAMDAAQDGCIIVVSQGTYQENLNLDGKNIEIRSADPEDRSVVAATIISGEGGDDSVITIQNCNIGVAINGFTITKGKGKLFDDYRAGGGIYIKNSSATIGFCVIENNEAEYGGGVYVEGALSIQNNTISGNTARYNGGGLYSLEGEHTIEGNEISENIAGLYGGGLFSVKGERTIVGNMISENTAFSGGGLYWESGQHTIVDNTISKNTATNYCGGGLWASAEGKALIADNSFVSNSAYVHGVGLWVGKGFIAVTDDADTLLVSPDRANTYESNIPEDVYLQP